MTSAAHTVRHAAPPQRASASEARARQPRNPRVAVIDDDPVFRALLKLHLANAGYEVSLAEDAVEGGHLIMRTPPDLIVCDVNMPYMNGYDFVAAVKRDPLTQHIPVIFVTVNHDVADHASQLGAVAYLHKPVTADRLLEAVGLFAFPDAHRGP